MKLLLGTSILLAGNTVTAQTAPKQPNIVFILSDDHGYSDVSWKNNKVKTPHMDKLRRRGMTIDGAYAQARCTPSRVSLLTGKYPWKIGFGGGVIAETAKGGVRLNETLMPQLLKDAGYDTHGFGKWHIGYCDERLRPHNRGFDTYFGHMGSGIDYYKHQQGRTLDYWRNDVYVDSPRYSTDEFVKEAIDILDTRQAEGTTDPFFMYMAFNAPHGPYKYPDSAAIKEFSDLAENRANYLSVVYRMDAMIGRLVNKLEQTGDMENTIIVFQADNGPTDGGNAFPLRGTKSEYAEGGVRVPAFVVGPGIPADTTLHRTEFLHLTDWIPTFLDFAGADLSTYDMDWDGHSFKDVFLNGTPSPREDLAHQITMERKGGGIYRKGDYKLAYKIFREFFGQGSANHTIPDEGPCPLMEEGVNFTIEDIIAMSNNVQAYTGKRQEAVLFNIREDPYELINIYEQNQEIAQQMTDEIENLMAKYKNVKTVDVNEASDQATLNHKDFPENSGMTTAGWCNADDI